MSGDSLNLILDQILLTKGGDAPQQPDVATFHVGGQKFQILEQTIRSRGQTLLHDLLEDPEHKDKAEPIYVNGDSERFRHILSWYIYGRIDLPMAISVEEMRRDCAFYGLPENVKINREGAFSNIPATLTTLKNSRKNARDESMRAGAIIAARGLFDILLSSENLVTQGKVCSVWKAAATNDCRDGAIKSALFPKQHYPFDQYNIHDCAYGTFTSTLEDLGQQHGLSITMRNDSSSQVTVTLAPLESSGVVV